uniref:Uncharacterized protein n=1 Tax=Maylandia zebra TaxID=106582 RepID=A0A3P9C5U9_9CICH
FPLIILPILNLICTLTQTGRHNAPVSPPPSLSYTNTTTTPCCFFIGRTEFMSDYNKVCSLCPRPSSIEISKCFNFEGIWMCALVWLNTGSPSSQVANC